MELTDVKEMRTARSTKTLILLIDNRNRAFMNEDSPWFTVCGDHGGLVGHSTRKVASSWMAEPEGWCPGCQESRNQPPGPW